MKAKAGETITTKARDALARAMGFARRDQKIDPCIPTKVEPKGDGKAGQWFCITCGALPMNNFEADGHPRSHKLAWRSFESGKIEEP